MTNSDPMTSRRRCTATSKQTGEPCGSTPAPGFTVCKWHGAKAPQVENKARQRILAAADPAAAVLVALCLDDTTPPAVRLAAARDLLDRAGEGAKQQVEVTTTTATDAELVRLAREVAAMDPAALLARLAPTGTDGEG